MFDCTAGDDDDRLARTCAERSRKMLRVRIHERDAVILDLGGIDEEARHGCTHGATPIGRYGAVVPRERLTAATDDGIELAVFVAGDGAALLLIPGLGARASVFDPIMPDLSRRHRVITYDPRGLGESGDGGDITLANMALDAVAVLDAARVGAAAVFGASMGGVIAQHLVVDHPERVARLMLAATAPGGGRGVAADLADQAALLGKGTRTPEDAYRLACTVLYSPQFQRAHPAFIEDQITERARNPVRPRVFSSQILAMAQADDSFERLAGVTAPTIVLHGTDDVVTPYENARILARQIPGATLRPFDGCGHLFFHERPAETARVVAESI